MFKNLTIKSRLIMILGFMSALLLMIGLLGLNGSSKTNDSLRSVYEDRTVALGQIDEIESLLLKNRLALAVAQVTPTPEFVAKQTDMIEKNIVEISKTWDAYMATSLTPEEKKLADKFADDRKRFVMEGLKPAVQALRNNQLKEAERIVIEKVRPLYAPVEEGVKALGKLQLDVAKDEYVQAQGRYNTLRNVSLASIIIGLGLAAGLGFLLIRAIVRPLAIALNVAEKVAAGDLASQIEIKSNDETGKLMLALMKMQQDLLERRNKEKVIADESMRVKRALDGCSTNVMIADNNLNIVYMNESVGSMLKTAESDLRKDLPNFNASKLMGENIDSFHKNPAHQRGML